MSDSAIIRELTKVLQPIVESAVEAAVAQAILEKVDPPPLRRLLTVDEASQRLGVSADTVRRLTKQEKLNAIRVLGALRIDQRDLENFIEEERK